MPEVKKRDDVEDQGHEEGREERDAASHANTNLRSLVPGGGSENTDNVVKSSE